MEPYGQLPYRLPVRTSVENSGMVKPAGNRTALGTDQRNRSASAKTERLELRLSVRSRRKLERASAIAETSLTEYVLRAAEAEADELLARSTSISLPDDAFDRFVAACDAENSPNEALRRAAMRARDRGIE